jgi:anti-sigma factor RsiW
MISIDKALRLQTWVDGELDPREAREVEAWFAQDPEAQGFAADLRQLKALMSDAEPERTLPEAREFYWSGILRGIEQAEKAAGRRGRERDARPSLARWWRWLVPVGALAALGLTPLLWNVFRPRDHAVLAIGQVVEPPIAGVNAFTFRSESEQMTVVWVDFNPE